MEEKKKNIDGMHTHNAPKHINGDGKQNGQLSSCTNLNQNIACELKIANGKTGRYTQQQPH